ncbi:MAG: hypothetical protein ACPG4K_07525 [Haloferula sp.]
MDKNETTPDELLGSFKGRSLKSIIVFTVVVHAVVLVGSSIPALLGGMAKEDISDMSEEERVAAAVKKANAALEVIDDERDRQANAALAEIAEAYAMEPKALGDELKKPAAKPAATPAPADEAPEEAPAPVEEDDEPKSEIEKEIEKVEEGPAVPSIDEEEEDLFK